MDRHRHCWGCCAFIGLNLYRSVQTSGGAEEAVQTVKLEEKEISSEVMVPGTLQFANEQYEYFEPEKGEIADIKVKEGDKVKKEMCFSPIQMKKFAWKGAKRFIHSIEGSPA